MTKDPYHWLEKSLETIHKVGWYRSVQTIKGLTGATVEIDNKNLINFASNDYLGLAGHPRLIEAAIKATKEYGTGTTGSRLITGHRPIHRQLELALASLKKTEDAIVFSSGYLANIGTISALVGKRDLILSDSYNHSSLKAGSILSQATVFNYRHNDIQDLENLLNQHRQNYSKCLLLTDSVFSMDGDICKLPALLNLSQKYSCMLLVDEAHGTGIFGDNGAGVVEHFGCTGKPLIQMGTLSKALGSLGGYVAGSSSLIDYLRNRAPSWIYTTGLSPADTAAALEAIALIQEEDLQRKKLWDNVDYFKQILEEFNIKSLFQESPIFCLPVKDAKTVMSLGKNLKESGMLTGVIRPPTVPTSRIRLTLIATHSHDHLEKLGKNLDIYLHQK